MALIKVGDLVTTLPSKEEAHVKSILVGNKEAEEAVQGQPVTIQLATEKWTFPRMRAHNRFLVQS